MAFPWSRRYLRQWVRRRSRGLEIVFELVVLSVRRGREVMDRWVEEGRSGVCGRKLGKACLKELAWGRRGEGGGLDWTGLGWAGLDWIGLD